MSSLDAADFAAGAVGAFVEQPVIADKNVTREIMQIAGKRMVLREIFALDFLD